MLISFPSYGKKTLKHIKKRCKMKQKNLPLIFSCSFVIVFLAAIVFLVASDLSHSELNAVFSFGIFIIAFAILLIYFLAKLVIETVKERGSDSPV
jgi:Kef-type K+ transport system membrane component KefB